MSEPTAPSLDPARERGWFHRRLLSPIISLLLQGASPQRLAWSIAAGAVLGVNPLLGSATLLCLAVAAALRLNIAATQAANYTVYPLQLLLVVPLMQLGAAVFRTAPLPLDPAAFVDLATHHPLRLVQDLWQWEWHALVVWAAFALLAAPLIALALTPLLGGLLQRLRRNQKTTLAVG